MGFVSAVPRFGFRGLLPIATRFHRAPWGKKKHLAPLPILSVVLLLTAMASPTLLRMTVTLVDDDSHLTIKASVQNVVHPSGPTGKIVGIMTVTNHGSADIQITEASARIQSLASGNPPGDPDNRLDTTITIKVPVTVRAGDTVNLPFSGPFAGNVLNLRIDDSFLVSPSITWFGVTSSSLDGPFTYSQAKICSGPGPSPSNPYWVSAFCTNV